MKKILTIALMLIVAFAVFAQGASEGKKNAAEDNSSKTVTFAMASAWTTFNPYADVTSYACITNDLIWDKLAFITPSENLPRNAKEWSMSADGKTYTFKLDPNAKWTDGQPVTALLVLSQIQLIRLPPKRAQYSANSLELMRPEMSFQRTVWAGKPSMTTLSRWSSKIRWILNPSLWLTTHTSLHCLSMS